MRFLATTGVSVIAMAYKRYIFDHDMSDWVVSLLVPRDSQGENSKKS